MIRMQRQHSLEGRKRVRIAPEPLESHPARIQGNGCVRGAGKRPFRRVECLLPALEIAQDVGSAYEDLWIIGTNP